MLDRLWAGGCQNGAELHRRLQVVGCRGSLRVVTEWATRRRHDASHTTKLRRKCPSARTIAKMMTTHRDNDARRQAALLALIERAAPDLVTARDQFDAFHAMVRERKPGAREPWIAAAQGAPLASFAAGLKADRSAVQAALREVWFSGQVEGQINRLKLLKRQVYGRAKAELLEARLVQAA